jgi:hypothetical protein
VPREAGETVPHRGSVPRSPASRAMCWASSACGAASRYIRQLQASLKFTDSWRNTNTDAVRVCRNTLQPT